MNIFFKFSTLPKFKLWDKMKSKSSLISFDLEITARCNNNCGHCYINLPAGNKQAQKKEMSLDKIKHIADEAISLGAVWCLITGGEPLVREDFFDIYLYLKQKGLLVSVFTNATLISQRHIRFFKKYPPRDIEVTVYGVTEETYERVTRTPGSFDKFMRGLKLLLKNGVPVRFKAMALRSNVNELQQIATFCRKRTKDYFRFDPFLHLRFDNNTGRNEEIRAQRLSPEEIVAVEQNDSQRFKALKKDCGRLIDYERAHMNCNHLFHCGTGNNHFVVSYNGMLRPCSSLWHPDCIYDLKKGTTEDALRNFIPKVRHMTSDRKEFLKNCHRCPIINLCIWCPAHSHLETGRLDKPVDYFCQVAHAREKMLTLCQKNNF